MKTDFNTYLETPVVLTLPPAGGKYVDQAFDTLVMRFTDERDGASFGTTYTVWPTMNCDNTKLWLYDYKTNSYFVGTLNPATFERVGALEPMTGAPQRIYANYEAAVWSFSDPDKIYCLVDAKLYYYKPSTKTWHLLKDLTSHFPAGWYFIQLYVSSDDNRFAAMMKDPNAADQGFMVYDLALDKVVRDVRTTDCNGITMDKSGKYVFLAPDIDPNQYIYNVDTGTKEALVSPGGSAPDYKMGHNDTGQDFISGNDQARGGYTARKMSTPHDVSLPFQYHPYWLDSHISLRADNEYWGLISTYGIAPVESNPDKNKFKRECFQVGLKEPYVGQIRRLFHHRCNWVQGTPDSYWHTTRANISRDGRFVCATTDNLNATGRTDLLIAKIDPAPSPSIPVPPSPPPAPPPPTPPPPTTPSPSPDGTKAVEIVDASGAKWTLENKTLMNGVLVGETFRNGVRADNGSGVIYKFVSSVVHVLGADDKTWFKWTGANWTDVPGEPGVKPPEPPQPPPPPVTKPEYINKTYSKTIASRNALYKQMYTEGYAAWEEIDARTIRFRLFLK